MNKAFGTALLMGSLAASLGMASPVALAKRPVTTTTTSEFTVNEAVVPGATAATLVADKITGIYSEVITFSGNTFTLSQVWSATAYAGGGGTTIVTSQLGGAPGPQYGLYMLYQATGTYTVDLNGAISLAYLPGGSMRLYLDPNSDTTFSAPASGGAAYTTGGSSEDILIATGTPTSYQGRMDPNTTTCSSSSGSGINCGSFGSSTSVSLTTEGTQYFAAPSPFFTTSFQSGQLNNFSDTGTQYVNGSMDMVFGPITVTSPLHGKTK
jgi:hypothetical protein